LKHETLQNSVDNISSDLEVFQWNICSIFGDSLLHRNEKCILRSTVNCWHIENPKGFSTPTRIANICLLSSIPVVADKLTHCPNTVSVFCHGCSTVLPRLNCIFCTFLLYFQLWPKQWHYWRQVRSLQFSRFVGSFWCIFSAHREPDERTVKRQTVFLVFFVLSFWYHALPSFSRGWTDLLGIDLPSDFSRSQSVGLPWTSDRPLAEITTWQHTTLPRDRHLCCRWDSNPQSLQLAVTDPLLRPDDHWNRPFIFCHRLLSLRCITSRTCYCQYYALTVRIHISTPAAVVVSVPICRITSHVNKPNLEHPLVTSQLNKRNLPSHPLPLGGNYCFQTVWRQGLT